ncbi:unnamed protein product [Cunninghamella echinulata]
MFATLELPIRDDSRHKRLQGGRACQPCRMKKIKCDGKQACMQCKARRRKCYYIKNNDESYIRLDATLTTNTVTNSNNNDHEAMDIVEHTKQEPDDYLFSNHSKLLMGVDQSNNCNGSQQKQPPFNRTDKLIEQLTDGLTKLTLNQQQQQQDRDQTNKMVNMIINQGMDPSSSSPSSSLDKNNSNNITPWKSYGEFIRWTPEAYPPVNYSVALEMPSRAIQEQLIDSFFSHCHYLLPTISRRLFYDQLKMKGPLITPLLLNIMYAHASLYDPLWVHQSKTFYYRARQLVDDFLDTPRMSTVIALLYLTSYDDGTHSSRCWMYCGMAVRMSLSLGLYKPNYYSNEMSQFDVEIRKRVLWACYVMDQLQSCFMERPSMLSYRIITLNLPTPLPEDNDEERMAVAALSHLCQLVIILEKVVVFFTQTHQQHSFSSSPAPSSTTTHLTTPPLSSSSTSSASNSHHSMNTSTSASKLFMNSLEDEQQVLIFLNEIKRWRDKLPLHLTWYEDNLKRQQDSFSNMNNNNNNKHHKNANHHNSSSSSSMLYQNCHWTVINLNLLSFVLELSLHLCCQYHVITDREQYLIRTISQLVSLTLQQASSRISMTLTAFSGLFCTSAILSYHAMKKLNIHDNKNNHNDNNINNNNSTTIDEDGNGNNVIATLFRQGLIDIRQCLQYISAQDIQRFSHLIDLVLTLSTSPSLHNHNNNNNLSPSSLFMDQAMDANMAAAAAAVVSATGVVGGDHDLDTFNNNIHHPHQQGPSPSTYFGGHIVPSMYDDKSNNSLSHVLPHSATNTMKTSMPIMLPLQVNSSSSTSRSSFGLPPISTTSINPHSAMLAKQSSIEPADYTFELISVTDEWARSLNYDQQQQQRNNNNNQQQQHHHPNSNNTHPLS